MKIAEFLSPQAVIPDLSGKSKAEVLRELSLALVHASPQLKAERLLEVLQEREKLGSTGIGEGVAIPHGKLAGLSQLQAAFGVSRSGVDFDAIDGRPTHLFFALVAPENSAGVHLKALARISRLLRDPGMQLRLRQERDRDAVYRMLTQKPESHAA